ncbi:unnamed protein product, partial [Porites evermanni]
MILDFHKEYKGLCIEFKSPTNNYYITESQLKMKEKYRNNDYAFILSNDYDNIGKLVHKYMAGVRILCKYCPKAFSPFTTPRTTGFSVIPPVIVPIATRHIPEIENTSSRNLLPVIVTVPSFSKLLVILFVPATWRYFKSVKANSVGCLEYKKLARNTIEADALTRQVRDVIKTTKWQKQNMREGLNQNRLAITEGFDKMDEVKRWELSQLPGFEAIEDLKEDDGVLPSTSDEGPKIAKFKAEDLDRYLNSKDSQDILKINEYYKLPPEYFKEDISTINKVIDDVNEDLEELSARIKNTADFVRDANGYVLAQPKSGRLVIKPTRKQIEGGFLGTLTSIGIPMAISLVSKMFGSGLQVDRRGSTNTANVYIPHPPPPPTTH